MSQEIHKASPYPMLPVPEALSITLKHTPIMSSHTVDIQHALGRVLAQDVHAADPLPPFPASIKDGYAVVAEDGLGEYPIIGIIAAGQVPAFTVTSGHVAKITTGAPVPPGANAVIQVEDTVLIKGASAELDRVRILKAASKPNQDIRPIGSDINTGDVVLKTGEVLGPAEIGILATVGVTKVPVYSAPVVGVLSTGDELVEPSETPGPGKIRDSNRTMLLAAINSLNLGVQVIDLGIASDKPDDLEQRMIEGLKQVDVLFTSGGVSMGDFDLIQPILSKYGQIHFGRICMKPGKPLTFATVTILGKSKLVFGLPGNPVSSLVTFQLFGIPTLRKMCGHGTPELSVIQAKITKALKLDPQRPEYHRATIRWDQHSNCFIAESTGAQASSRLLSMRTANALLLLPQESGVIESGSFVPAYIIGAFAN
eukprot:TRINITY_DN3849_c0_g1_i1.p1 TRINITY_DN3849_c0_g1~~TRINITY_DN3849_c0_g1_i1.p1  ORF type:complete len:426 (-),score=130.06 TRINITY_DN3849_c0_g1_i1:558-1835(-)